MRLSVVDRWREFSEPLEGRVSSMYLDVKGLVTTCVGNLIDTPQEAAKLPWRHGVHGPLASREEVFAAWRQLKGRQDLAKKHWKYAAALNDLRLTEEAMDDLVASKRAEFYAYLRKNHFPAIDGFPADAQLGIMSMAWACGPGFPRTFANFKRCVLVGDWNGAVDTCKIRETNNPGVVPRNKANRTCFGNAAIVVQSGLDPEILWWPGTPAVGDVSPAPAPAPKTRPVLRKGSGGPDATALEREHVEDLQGLLNFWLSQEGMSQLLVDGDFGPKTELVVEDYQSDHHLDADGVVGPKTWAALEG